MLRSIPTRPAADPSSKASGTPSAAPLPALLRRLDNALTLPDGTAPRHVGQVARLLRWKLVGDRYDADHVPAGLSDRFVSARGAAELVADDATVLASGFGAFHAPSVLYWAIRDRFLTAGHPSNLTLCAVTGLGGRSKSHGTIEELAHPGLVTTAVMGHAETAHAFLQLADAGQLELHTLPQGVMTTLVTSIADGQNRLTTQLGSGTYLDPRTGPGSAVLDSASRQLVTVEDNQLTYELPTPDVFLASAASADRDGNLYLGSAAMLTELRDGARSVRAAGGKVIVCVSEIIDFDGSQIHVPGDWVDAIVVSPTVSQLHSVPHSRAWSMFTPDPEADDIATSDADIRFINRLIGAAPKRSAADAAMARAASTIAARHLQDGALVNIGTGLPEEVGRVLHQHLGDSMTLTTEAGAIGGQPTTGLFFGAALRPEKLISPAEMFARYREGIDLACLGMLEFDSEGNVNVSRRGDLASQYVGPGGFLDIAENAQTVIFVGSFGRGEQLRIENQQLRVKASGQSKLVDHVREITFSGNAAIRRGQRVYYVTHRAIFMLTDAGLELLQVMPGINIDRDVLAAPGRVVTPSGGLGTVAVADQATLTGQRFQISIR